MKWNATTVHNQRDAWDTETGIHCYITTAFDDQGFPYFMLQVFQKDTTLYDGIFRDMRRCKAQATRIIRRALQAEH